MSTQKVGADYLSIAEAAQYLGVSPITLRRWDEVGKLKPVRHPVSDYRFYRRADLEPFRLVWRRAAMRTAQVGDLFVEAAANIEANDKLREPQREAHPAVRKHFQKGTEHAIVQFPMGCGKTGLIAILPFRIARGRVLVITPNCTIRDVVHRALDIASDRCFWTKTRVLSDFAHGPFTAVLDGSDANLHDCDESHFVVTNIQQLASSADRWLPQFPPGFFDMIVVDEGHHNVAESWQRVFERFPEAKVVSLTATPFRSDGKPLSGKVVYRYSFTKAMVKGYIKQIHSINVAPAEISFTYRGSAARHTLKEVLELREEHWFRKGVALAPECNRHVAEASVRYWRDLKKQTGHRHQIIAVTCSVDHAKQVRGIYESLGLKAAEIHSDMPADRQRKIKEDLEHGRLECVVQVLMLGEGFDEPNLSVAAIFRPFRSLSPYIQFVGRVMRVIHEEAPGHPDNQAYLVSHVGLNNDEHWDDFRQFDRADQVLFRRWLTTSEEGKGDRDGLGVPRRFDAGPQGMSEIVSHFIADTFLDPEDDRVLEELLAQPVGSTGLRLRDVPGITKESLREGLRVRKAALEKAPEALPVAPQRRRRVARKRLAERPRSVAMRILKEIGLARAGREIGNALSEARGAPNFQAAIRLLNLEVNEALGITKGTRGKLKATEAELGVEKLDEFGDRVRDRIRAAMGKN